jgi:quercetin dioxygenase-like cupin family protein
LKPVANMTIKPITEHQQDDVDLEDAERVRMRMLIGPEQGARVFYMRHFEVQPGGHTPHHQHDYEHEVLVIKGRGIAKGGQGDYPIGPGNVVWIPPNEKHQFQNTGSEPLEFICLIPATKN